MRRPLPPSVRDRLQAELDDARVAIAARRFDDAWRSLERAHVLSQPWPWPHIRVHVSMLGLGWRVRDLREVRGQVLRLVGAGPVSYTGKIPIGNTGRARVPTTMSMPVPPDLAAVLQGAGVPV